MHTEIRDVAQRYLDIGWSVIPLRPNEKRPVASWKRYATVRPDVKGRAPWEAEHVA